ncbi:Ig-like domain-containing protein [Actinoplanes sp. DH11]|uniref:Ig-like domain-containing protein n=1 Tax=Actinoplanes sp. DH11 TaxID=2857011 RepID=UPI001E32FB42|nr:Ig-like domain-containing protein [Actinoplanes sp. DH11]
MLRRLRTVATALLPFALLLPAAPARAAVTPLAAINFQPATSTVPAGHTADTGAAFSTTRGSGWVRQDDRTPLDLTANARDRARAGIAARLNTVIHLQYGDTGGTNGVATPAAWEYVLPAGRYQVTVSAGDQPAYDSSHTVRVEGTPAISGFVPTAAAEFRQATVTVGVTDGRLTVDAAGGTNTKLNYVEIARVTDEPPAALTATPSDGQVALGWTGSSGAFQILRNGTLLASTDKTSYLDTSVANGTAYSYQVRDAQGQSNTVTATPAAFALKVNFSDAATAPPAGYLRDSGDAYTAGRGYGWVDLGERTPVNLTGNGRNRNPAAGQSDVRLATLMHAQLPAGSGGTPAPGAWEAALPAGLYTVTVAVGDAGTAVNSAHWANVEDQNAIAAFVPTAATRHATATRTVRVTDGKLTLTPSGGTNTKFNYIDIASVPAWGASPGVRASTPPNLATAVPTTSSVVEDLVLPGGGVAASSLTPATVTLTRLGDPAPVAATVITSGGGDVVNLSPTAPLAANTSYRFTLTSGVKDVIGKAFTPYSIVFTTGSGGGSGGPIAFDKTVGVATGAAFTTVVTGPDGRLWAGTLDGRIFRFPINTDGTLGTPAIITAVRDNAAALGLPGAPARTVIGMAFDPVSQALWVTDNYQYVGPLNVPDWSGRIGRLAGPGYTTYTPVVTGLPRSVKDHESNSIAFGPDGALYLSQGANNAMGAPDSTWGNRPERLLSAAILRLDPARLPATLPLNVQTSDGGGYDPYAAGAALTLHATGVRNAYDLTWHRNGHLYAPTNGSAAGGNTPATPVPLPAACTRRGYTGPAVPALNGVPTSETDYVFDVKPGRYYGHPNPVRCEWVLAGGNPSAATDPFEVPAYPAGTRPDPNFDLAGTYDAGLHASANGVLEYRGNAFGGALDGKLLVVRYSAGQDIQTFDVAASGALSNRTTGRPGLTGFSQPLDVTEDLATGNLYVTELGANRITLLKPRS